MFKASISEMGLGSFSGLISRASLPFVLCAILASLGAVPAPSFAAQTTAPAPERRVVFALYDSKIEAKTYQTRIHNYAEMPLNHLGYVVHYRDVGQDLPSPSELEGAAGVITWFSENVPNPVRYLEWAESAAARGTRFIVLGNVGGDDFGDDLNSTNAFLRHLGLRQSGEFLSNTTGTRVTFMDRTIYEFEVTLDQVLPPLDIVTAIDAKTQSTLSLRPARWIGADVIVASIGPGGGYAADGYEWRIFPGTDRVKWLIDPFAFFHKALGSPRMPVPDVTTVSGRRLYFSHVDGDGWLNVSTVERYKKLKLLSAEVMLKELIEPYPDLPVTIGLIAADIDPAKGGDPHSQEIARRILALPQVELGSHTYTHPFDWDFYEHYDRAKELALIESNHESNMSWMQTLIRGTGGTAHFHSGNADLPRAYMKEPFDIQQEVAGSIAEIERYAPAGKRVKLYQWSGDTNPFPEVLKATREAGVRNINGGDSRYDIEFPSVAYVCSIGRQYGTERQIYAVNANENIYTNNWTGPYHGFAALSATFKNTEAPRRLKGVNVYYHTYSAEKTASLEVLKAHLDNVRASALTPIAASHYVAIAEGFYNVTITRVGEQAWAISNRGALDTLRFDDAADVMVDTARSSGVLGENRRGGSLYVALDAAEPEAIVALAPRSLADGNRAPRPLLTESRWRIHDLSWTSGCKFSFKAEGFGRGEFVWQGAERGATYEIAATRGDGIVAHVNATASDKGRLSFKIDADAIDPLAVQVDCNREMEHNG